MKEKKKEYIKMKIYETNMNIYEYECIALAIHIIKK